MPAELVDPHPLVRAAATRLKRRDGWDHPAGVRSAPKEVLDLQVTRNALDRARLLALGVHALPALVDSLGDADDLARWEARIAEIAPAVRPGYIAKDMFAEVANSLTWLLRFSRRDGETTAK